MSGQVIYLNPERAATAARTPDRRGPWLLVAAAVAWNLVSLRAETLPVSYLDDASVHEQMVRFATGMLRAGHLPLTSWFPFLGLGSPQFLHYQSLPATLTGALGLITGPDAAFRWTLYLLLSLWPVSVYAGTRLFGADRWAGAMAAAMAPFLVSASGIGYEQQAYLWIGYGVWTQLWASFTLPLAWGLSWRAIRDGRHRVAAVVLISLTLALHFETGYLALLPLLVWPFVCGSPAIARLRRAGVLVAGTLLCSAWVIVPLLDQRAWAATNEALRGTGMVNGYGAGRVLGWLATGQLLDHGRLPIITVLAAVGLAVTCARARTSIDARAVLVALGLCLLLSFGRATFGGLVALIPGSGDIFFRRFMMGVQLVALILAGIGAAAAARAFVATVSGRWPRPPTPPRRPKVPRNELGRALLVMAAASILLTPAWIQLTQYDARNAAAIAAQRHSEATQGADVDRLVAYVNAHGGGRVYAGLPSNWGETFTVGEVPVFKYLESRDTDEVGYTLRTASLMTNPEYFFNDRDLSDYRLFGIRYLIIPSGYYPPVPARLLRHDGEYSLWALAASGYIQVGSVVGVLTADRTNIGLRSIPLLDSPLARDDEYLRVSYGHAKTRANTLPVARPTPPSGAVLSQHDDLRHGEADTSVAMNRPGTVVLSASFDPGWTATVDGHTAPTIMAAPALVGTSVTAGVHRIVFRYRGYAGYPALFALAAVTLLTLLALSAPATLVGGWAGRTGEAQLRGRLRKRWP